MRQIILLFIGLFLLNSCSKNEISTTELFDVDKLNSELSQDPTFQDFVELRFEFINLIGNKTINITGVNEIINLNTADYCELKDQYEGKLQEDVVAFSTYMCQEQSLKNLLLDKFPNYSKLPAEMYFKHFNLNEVSSTRVPNCLHEFHYNWALQDIFCADIEGNQCQSGYQNDAMDAYEDCCDGGGDGC